MFRTIATASALAPLVVWPVSAQTIEEAVREAISKHPSISSATATVRRSAAAIDQARSGWRPQIDLSVESGYQNTNSSGTRGRATRGNSGGEDVDAWSTTSNITLTQTLIDFGRTDGDVEAARDLRTSSDWLLDNARVEVALRATNAHMLMVQATDLINLVEEYVGWHDDIYEKTSLNVSAGIATTTDQASVRARQQQAINRSIQFEGLQRDAETRFVEAVGLYPWGVEDPELDTDIDFDGGLDGLIQEMFDYAPSLKASQSIIEARRHQRDSARTEYYPTITGEVQVNRDQNTDGVRAGRYDASALVRLDWNLYDGGADEAAIESAEADIDAAMGQEGEEKRRLEQSLRLAWNRFVTARDQLEYTENQVDAAVNIVLGRETEFDLDRASLQDLLDARNQQFDAEVAYINLIAEYSSAYYSLIGLTGGLFEELGVILPKTVYIGEDDVVTDPLGQAGEEEATVEDDDGSDLFEDESVGDDDGIDLLFDIGGGAAPDSE